MTNVQIILRICRTIIGLVGVLGNCLVILVICRVPFMHTLTIAFICHQAIIDFAASLLMVLKSNIPVPAQLPQTVGGEVLCRVWISDVVQYLLFVTSTFNLMALTLERYVAIVYPFCLRAMFSRRGAAVTMVVVWLLVMSLKVYSFFIYTVVDGKCVYQHLQASKVLGPLIICLQFFVPAAIMLFCYTHIALTLKRAVMTPLAVDEADDDHHEAASVLSLQQQHPEQRQQRQQQDQFQAARHDVLKTLVIVFATFLVCWTPGQVVFFMFNMGWLKLDLGGPLNVITTVLTASNCCVNPIIYSFKYKQFRRALRKMVGRSDDREYIGLLPTATTQTTDHCNKSNNRSLPPKMTLRTDQIVHNCNYHGR